MDDAALAELSVTEIRDALRAKARAAISALGADGAAEVAIDLNPPPNAEMGDYGFPCFPLARLLRKAPPLIAKDLAENISADALIESVNADGPYLNFRLRPQALVRVVVGEVLRRREAYASAQVKEPEHFMVEFSSPNTNKPLHLGHIRNNLLGASVSALLAHYGHKVSRINLVNDRGVHICKSMLAYKHWGDETDPQKAGKKGDHLVGDFYVLFDRKFTEEYQNWQSTDAATEAYNAWKAEQLSKKAPKKDQKGKGQKEKEDLSEKAFFSQHKDTYFNDESPLGAEVREMLVDWEAEEKGIRALWSKMNGWVLKGFEESYARMGVAFDRYQFESDTYRLGKALVQEGLEKGVLAKRADGATVCDLDQIKMQGEKVLLRGDGTSVYMTQDLGTAVERFDDFGVEKLIYVVGDEQIYHFDVLFKILGLLRDGLSEKCKHLAYGMIRLPEGKMKSREGTVVDADDLMDEMHRLAKAETESRAAEGKAHTEGISAEEVALRAERIGLAALKYYLLKFSPRKSFEYDPKESIDFLGQTGPYCLFNYARTRSLLRKAGGEPELDFTALDQLGTDRELEIVRSLAQFTEVVAWAAKSLDPSRIAEYLFDLCKSFAFIFSDKENHPIATCTDPQLRHGRLLLAAAVGNTVKTGLALLGIEVLEEM
jgi:arginyl-tRNA synthetase